MKDLFHSAALKLTLWYLLIIMVLSLGCSLALYRLSVIDLQNNSRRQVGFFNDFLAPSDLRSYTKMRESQLGEDRNHLRDNLVLFNLMVLVTGGVVSYALARRTMEPIEEAMESQKRFAGDASHELRTPLAVMQSEIEVALRAKSLTKAQATAQLRSNLEEVGKLKSLSDGLLRLASESGKNLAMENVAVKEVIKEAVNRQSKNIGDTKISLTQTITNFDLKGDRQSLVELINLILDNAVKYSPRGSEISITAKKRAKQAHITISDRGQGISAVDLPHIFDRFYRANMSRSKNSTPGYGLGLAIAKKIIDLHGGSITVSSAPGKGASFTIQLPLA